MEFDKSKVFTVLNASEVKIGSKGYFADELTLLKERVSNKSLSYYGELTTICPGNRSNYCFEMDNISNWLLFYLVEEPGVNKMIKDEVEHLKCSACKRTYLKLEITSYGICKDCLIEKLKCCENCADYDGQDCDMDNENRCRCFTGDENDNCYWRLKED